MKAMELLDERSFARTPPLMCRDTLAVEVLRTFSNVEKRQRPPVNTSFPSIGTPHFE